MSRTDWNLDATHSQVEFSVKHMMFTTVRGRFGALEGTIHLDSDAPERSSVEVSIDAASLDTQVADRDAHLRSPDFFDVESHPTMEFRSRRVDGPVGSPRENFRVLGDLTIRGFEGTGTDPWGGTRAGFSAETTIDRRDFGLTWNQALETGGVLVGHEVKIDLQIQAVQVQEAAAVGAGAE